MSKFNNIYLMMVACFISATAIAQEFPIAIGRDTTFCVGGIFDGTNFGISIHGDTISSSSITAQIVSSNGNLVGPRISLGSTGGFPVGAFDGINCLTIWNDKIDSIVYGQFISTSGVLVGPRFTIVDHANISPPKGGYVGFNDTTYMVIYKKSNHVPYAQRISKSGNLIGAPTKISTGPAKDIMMASDGTNYLVAWWGDTGSGIYITGQLISKTGELIGSNFTIDGPGINDNEFGIGYDGRRYLFAYRKGTNIYARFVTTYGSIDANTITVGDSLKYPYVPAVVFDGINYLITWSYFIPHNATVMGRFFSTSGNPLDTAFTIFSSLGNKFPYYAVPIYGNGKFLVVTTRVDTNFTDGDIYGKFIPSSTTGVSENGENLTAKEYSLSQNYPNPFNPSTNISFSLIKQSFVSLKVFDLLGREVAIIVSEEMLAGNYLRQWNAANMTSGIYFYRMQAGLFTETKKLILLK